MTAKRLLTDISAVLAEFTYMLCVVQQIGCFTGGYIYDNNICVTVALIVTLQAADVTHIISLQPESCLKDACY